GFAVADDLRTVRVSAPLGLEFLQPLLAGNVERQRLTERCRVAGQPFVVLATEGAANLVLEVEDRERRAGEQSTTGAHSTLYGRPWSEAVASRPRSWEFSINRALPSSVTLRMRFGLMPGDDRRVPQAASFSELRPAA